MNKIKSLVFFNNIFLQFLRLGLTYPTYHCSVLSVKVNYCVLLRWRILKVHKQNLKFSPNAYTYFAGLPNYTRIHTHAKRVFVVKIS